MDFSKVKKGGAAFIGYEYKTVNAESGQASMVVDGYANFGWIPDEAVHRPQLGSVVELKLKRDRKIINKMELTRLQQHFEACIDEINALERSKTHAASIAALSIGVIGTAFIAGSTFAVTHAPPMILLCILLAIPGFIGWILPYFVFKHVLTVRTNAVAKLIEQKYDEAYEVCERGNALLCGGK